VRKARVAALGAVVATLMVVEIAAAATLEPIGPATYASPTHVTSDPRDPDRLFVVEQPGLIKVTTPAGTSTFLDLTDESVDNGEQGVWSMAFAPDFAATGRFYVAYAANDGALTLDEYREQSTPDATEVTRRQVLSIANNPGSTNHNGGQLQFGPDGYLYWSTGDDANAANAQMTSNLLGKILRIDPRQNGAQPYTVPSDNPFVGVGVARPEIWSLGLRNPWRFSFDRLTGAIAIADVGAGSWEEVDHVARASGGGRGANYGWPCFEGTAPGPGPCGGPIGNAVAPVYSYESNNGPCAITGGYVVRDPDLGDLYGRYLFADFCAGELSSIDPANPPAPDAHRVEGLSVSSPTSFGEDACGRLYVVSAGAGRVFRLEGPTGGACPPPDPAVDTDPPETTVKLRPKNKRRSKATATLRSDEPGSTFECKLDRRKWKPCDAKKRLKGLESGRHRVRARATDAAGNTDPTPARRGFRTKRR
jgi:glucose/arabinose dehydrogenase